MQSIDAIIMELRQHPNDPDVQEQGCRALQMVAFNDDNQVAIAQKEGIDAIVTALQQHITHAGVQEKGCWGLRNLSLAMTTTRWSLPRREASMQLSLRCGSIPHTLAWCSTAVGR